MHSLKSYVVFMKLHNVTYEGQNAITNSIQMSTYLKNTLNKKLEWCPNNSSVFSPVFSHRLNNYYSTNQIITYVGCVRGDAIQRYSALRTVRGTGSANKRYYDVINGSANKRYYDVTNSVLRHNYALSTLFLPR